MNIYDLLKLKTLNIEKELENITCNEGTFRELLEKVYDGTISALVDNAGNVIGLNYNTNGGNDALEELKFRNRYLCKPVMDWTLKAFEIYVNNNSYREVVENDEVIKVILNDGSEVIISEEGESDVKRAVSDLPEEVVISFDQLGIDDSYDCDDRTKNIVKKYLRDTYGHYLSGFASDPEIEIDVDEQEVLVTNICWGRAKKAHE